MLNILLTILAAILVFGSVIFIHELGHFIAAKRSGIKVNEFALGMGPTLFKFKRGETKYALRLLPIGGFVSMEGEDEESEHERSFQQASIPRRLVTILAGAFMNFVLGFIVLAVLTATGGVIASHTVALVENEATGLEVGDVITHVNGRRIFIMNDLSYEFLRTENGTFDLTVRRNGEKLQLQGITFETVTHVDAAGDEYEQLLLGFKVLALSTTIPNVLREAFGNMLSYSRLILLTVSDLIMGRAAVNSLSGPVGIISELGKAVSFGWDYVFSMLALISINLGVVNLLPFPALDGGRAVLLVVEAIRRRPLNQKYEIALNLVGFALLMCLMIYVSFNDVTRLFF